MTAIGHPSRRSFVRAAGALLPLWAAIGCKKHASAGPGQTLTLGLSTDTAIIDPSVTGSSITALITRNVVDSLIGQAEDGRFTPWLAESWEADDGGARYSFHLRSGVTFSDGTSLDAVAVKFNLDRILDPKTSSSYARSLLGPVDSVTAPDASTLVIAYQQPFRPLLQGLTLPYLGIQSPAWLRTAQTTTNSVVGSGPFVLNSFVRGSGSRLSRRQDYNWGPGYAAHTGAAHLDAILFKYLPEASVRVGALISGQVQAIDDLPPANLQEVQTNGQLEILTRENPGINRSFFLNTSKPPFDDLRVRQAFQRAVDGASAVKIAYFDTLRPADNILSPLTLDYDPTVVSDWGFDPAKAARLLGTAGWTLGPAGVREKAGQQLSVRLVYDSAGVSASDVVLAQAVQFQVAKAGFDLQLDPVDAGGYVEQVGANDYELIAFYFVRDEPDILRTVFHSAYIPPNGGNVSRVKSLDDKLIEAVGASDEERKRLYSEIQHEIIDQAYAVPIYIAAYQLAATKQLQGLGWATNAKPTFYDASLGA